jgi:hypothetical protein
MEDAMSQVLTNARVYLGTSTSSADKDFSSVCRSVKLSYTADLHDDTVMGMTAHSNIQGLYKWTAELELIQDYGSTTSPVAIDKTLFDLADNRVKFLFSVRPVNAARTSDNPEFSGPARIESYEPISAAVGDLLVTKVPIVSAGNLSRTVSAS